MSFQWSVFLTVIFPHSNVLHKCALNLIEYFRLLVAMLISFCVEFSKVNFAKLGCTAGRKGTSLMAVLTYWTHCYQLHYPNSKLLRSTMNRTDPSNSIRYDGGARISVLSDTVEFLTNSRRQAVNEATCNFIAFHIPSTPVLKKKFNLASPCNCLPF